MILLALAVILLALMLGLCVPLTILSKPRGRRWPRKTANNNCG